MPPKALPSVGNKDGEDMDYLKFSRGPGSALVFRMRTPRELVGVVNPQTGEAFGREIGIGLGTRRLAEARHRRDIRLGQIRNLQRKARGGTAYPQWSTETALIVREQVVEEEERGLGPGDQEIRAVIYDQIDRAKGLPASRRPPAAVLKNFAQVAFHGDYPLSEAVEGYVADRAKGNRQRNRALTPQRSGTSARRCDT